MNLEIRQKYNNFINAIEKYEQKEKPEWIKQCELNEKCNVNNLLNDGLILTHSPKNISENTSKKFCEYEPQSNNCECDISCDYSSFDKKTKSISNPEHINNKDCEFSLLKSNCVINSNSISDDDINTIKSEFKHLFDTEHKKDKKNKSQKKHKKPELSVDKKLDKIYDKMLLRQNTNDDKKSSDNIKLNMYDLNNYVEKDYMDNPDKLIGILSNWADTYLFMESTRGWNFDFNVYVLNFSKLKDNLGKILFLNDCNIKFGYIYRDFENTTTLYEKDFTKNWIGCENSSGTFSTHNTPDKHSLSNQSIQANQQFLNQVNQAYRVNQTNQANQTNYTNQANQANQQSNMTNMKYTTKDKILYYCFKNLIKTDKFKKRIGHTYYKFMKKTIQVCGNSNFIIDIIFYVGIK